MRQRRRLWPIVAVAGLGWLLVDRPWTIRPLRSTGPGAFDAAGYVASIWDRARAHLAATAAERDVPAAGSPAATADERGIAVSIAGRVVRVDSSSRVGLALVDRVPEDGRVDAAVQIGPVIRGSAIRDALPFVRFTDFPNQIAFAAVASALNDRALDAALRSIDTGALVGRLVRVLGAAALPVRSAEPLLITPVVVEVETR